MSSPGQKEELSLWRALVQLIFMAKVSDDIAAFCKSGKQIACHKQMRKLTKAPVSAETKMSLSECLSCSVDIKVNANGFFTTHFLIKTQGSICINSPYYSLLVPTWEPFIVFIDQWQRLHKHEININGVKLRWSLGSQQVSGSNYCSGWLKANIFWSAQSLSCVCHFYWGFSEKLIKNICRVPWQKRFNQACSFLLLSLKTTTVTSVENAQPSVSHSDLTRHLRKRREIIFGTTSDEEWIQLFCLMHPRLETLA